LCFVPFSSHIPYVPSALHKAQITVRDGNFTDLDSLEPTITWENTALIEDVHVRYGIDLSARTSNIATLPRRIWGKASRVFDDRFAVSARAEVDVQLMERVDFEIDAEDENNDLTVRVVGSARSTGGFSGCGLPRPSFIEFTKSFENDGNRVTVNPRYDVRSKRGDVVVSYDADDTLVTVTASEDDQVVTISQKLNDENMVSPTLSRDGSLSLAWDRKLGDDNSIRATLNPNRSVEVEWKDSAWTANVLFPMDDNSMEGATVHLKRDLKF